MNRDVSGRELLAISSDGILAGEDHPTILLMDRDTKFSLKFRDALETKQVKPIVLPPRSPNLSAFRERYI